MLRNKRLTNNLLLLLITTVFCLLIAEVGLRKFLGSRLGVYKDERNLTYRYDRILGWFPMENSSKQYQADRLIDIKHNSRGFRDDEHVISARPRMMVLGDSFVWGYDVEKSERFTEKLRKLLPNWSVYNLGVSGYGTDQEYLLLQQNYDYYKPNIVFLVFCNDNDEDDNTRNIRYAGYYKPYFGVKGSDIELKGTPVPKSENYFFVNHDILAHSYLARLAAKAYFKSINPPLVKTKNPTYRIISEFYAMSIDKGFQFIMGLEENSPQLESFLFDEKIPYVILANPYRFSSENRHWTPKGHDFVADKIYRFLLDNDYLKADAGLTR